MSEHSQSAEMGTPRDRAIAYLEMRQHGHFRGGKDKNIKTPIWPEKTRRPEPMIQTMTAYEKLIDTMDKKGYEGSAKILADMRPGAYDALRGVQWGAKIADYVITSAIWLPKTNRLIRQPVPAAGGAPAVPGMGLGDKMPLSWMRDGFSHKAISTWAVLRYRPIEWATAQATKLGGAIISSDAVAPIVNRILGGGERVQKQPAETPQAT
jgi:hypothetical protein